MPPVYHAAARSDRGCSPGRLPLSGEFDKAQAILRWSADQNDKSRFPICTVKLAEARMVRALAEHGADINVLPPKIADKEREGLESVVGTLRPVLESVIAAGKPTSELELCALKIALQANHLLQKRELVGQLLILMNHWQPVPIEVARGVVSGYIDAPPDLPERLRRDHPSDLESHILAGVVQSSVLSQHSEAFTHAKSTESLADSDEKKEELFRLFQQIWQHLEGPEQAECEVIAKRLVAHSFRLLGIFEAAILLRKGDADAAIRALDRDKAEDDAYWLQLQANAHLQKGQIGEAVEFLLVAAKQTFDAGLLHKTGDLAYQAEKLDEAVWCYERLVELQPENVAVHGNLAHIYASELHDLEKAITHFRAMHSNEPAEPQHTFNLAFCLAQYFNPEESLELYGQLCEQSDPTIQAVVGRAQLHHGLGRVEEALASFGRFRERFFEDVAFLLPYMTVAHAAGDEDAAHDALAAMVQMQESGNIAPEVFRAMKQDEAVETFVQMRKETQERDEHFHTEMLRGRMPWGWAEQMSNNSVYSGWRIRTQDMAWIGEDPVNLARYCVYSSNSFHARVSERGVRELLPLECPPAGVEIVADISALITLHRLKLLDAAATHFGNVIVPAGYLPTILEDSRRLLLGQLSQKETAEQIIHEVNSENIVVLEKGGLSDLPKVDEHDDSAHDVYRLVDMVTPVHAAGLVSSTEFESISKVCVKASGVNTSRPELRHLQDVEIDLSSLEVLTRFGLLDATVEFYRIHISWTAQRELIQRLEFIKHQEETRNWHMDLWTKLRGDKRFQFVPHVLPDEIRQEKADTKDYLPFLASFIARERNVPLLADDRVCQVVTLNQANDDAQGAFGTDVLVVALLAAGTIDPIRAAAAIHQLMTWRFRFLVPTAGLLKIFADQHKAGLPGRALQSVAEYVQDCMRDPGLFGGPEKTALGESMAMRFYLVVLSSIAEFLILVWADDGFAAEDATRLTEWCARELLPAIPSVLEGHGKARSASLTFRLVLSRALILTGSEFGDPRMADAMKAIKVALRINDEDYMQIITEILNDAAGTQPHS